jgi:hypothetical protein
MDASDVQRIAARWVEAWDGDEPAVVLALLHPDAVLADPEAGKVRPPDIAGFVARSIAVGPLAERLPVIDWFALPGADSVAVVCTLADGRHRVDTLVLADDGRVVRLMRHA